MTDFRDRFVSAYHAELDAFLALARGDGPNFCDLAEAVQTQRLVTAAQTALDERRVIAVGDQPIRSGRGDSMESEAQ